MPIFIDLLATAYFCVFFFNDPATPEIYTLSLHDALPISLDFGKRGDLPHTLEAWLSAKISEPRSEEHTSELQARRDLVCRLLLEKKKKHKRKPKPPHNKTKTHEN